MVCMYMQPAVPFQTMVIIMLTRGTLLPPPEASGITEKQIEESSRMIQPKLELEKWSSEAAAPPPHIKQSMRSRQERKKKKPEEQIIYFLSFLRRTMWERIEKEDSRA